MKLTRVFLSWLMIGTLLGLMGCKDLIIDNDEVDVPRVHHYPAPSYSNVVVTTTSPQDRVHHDPVYNYPSVTVTNNQDRIHH